LQFKPVTELLQHPVGRDGTKPRYAGRKSGEKSGKLSHKSFKINITDRARVEVFSFYGLLLMTKSNFAPDMTSKILENPTTP
jgi:hypothetical protein